MLKESFKSYFENLIGPKDAKAFFEAISDKKIRRSLRVQTLKTSSEELKKWFEKSAYEVTKNPYCPDGIDISGRGALYSLKIPYDSGQTYPQDSSSMFAVKLLDPKAHEWVVDLTAAPGGKSTHIASLMKNTGVLLANDMDSRRHKALRANLERLGIFNTVLSRMSVAKLAHLYPEQFDRVLLDPSCSGEGLLVTHEGKPKFWSEKALKSYAKQQFQVLKQAYQLLKPGGRLVFSTCTLNTIENDGVVEKFLSLHPDLEVLSAVDLGLKVPPTLGNFMGSRFWPQETRTKGFFCIAFKKLSSSSSEVFQTKHFNFLKALSKKEYETIQEKLTENYGSSLDIPAFVRKQDQIYGISQDLLEFPIAHGSDLSFPILQEAHHTQSLSRGAAVLLGLRATKNLHHLSDEEIKALYEGTFKSSSQKKDSPQDILVAHGFPLGFAHQALRNWA